MDTLKPTPNEPVHGPPGAVPQAAKAKLRNPAALPLKPRQSAGPCALSFAQERLWFIDQFEPNVSLYNIGHAWRLTGRLDLEALNKSLNAIVARHESLRTTFRDNGGAPLQVIGPERPVCVTEAELKGTTANGIEPQIRDWLLEQAAIPFDLTRDLMLRVSLLRVAGDDHVLLLTIHHIAADGWSFAILFQELTDLYDAYSRAVTPAVLPLAIQYSDFAVWQREWVRDGVLDEQAAYWKKKLAGIPEVLPLPLDRPRRAARTYHGASESMLLPRELIDELQAVARKENATLFMTALAAFQTLLFRYTRCEDIVVGSPIAGRVRPEVEGLIGLFVNTLVLRADCSGNPAFREFLARVRGAALEAYDHQHLPFEKLVSILQPTRNPSYAPLCQVMLSWRKSSADQLRLGAMRAEPINLEAFSAKFDLTVHMIERQDGIWVRLDYSTELFDAATIRRFATHYRTLLEGVAKDAGRKLSELPILTPGERAHLLSAWNQTNCPYPRRCVHELFEAQAERAPRQVALVHGEEELTYAELNRRANALARHLRTLGVATGIPVGLCVERSVEMIVGLLGILKAGGAYVPLDPAYPAERMALMLQDTAAPVLLTQSPLLESLPGHSAAVVCLDRFDFEQSETDCENLRAEAGPDSLAYVIYTSGSTGTPKGVAVPHRGIVRLFFGCDYAHLDEHQTFLLTSSLAFDVSTFEIWGPLLHGGRLVLCPERVPTAAVLGRMIRRHGVTTLWLTSALFNAVVDEAPEELRPLRQLLLGGEALSVRHVRRALSALPETQLVNGYGPTEATTFACCYRIPPDLPESAVSVPIGKPIGNTRVYVLDDFMQPVPVGVYGELYIGGDGLALGYLNAPELTSAKFVPDPFAPGANERLYKTGDLVRYLPDGNIEFLGRRDHQIKLRGYRIELGEIETALELYEAVKAAIVLLREDAPGDKSLAAYVVPAESRELKVTELRDYLRHRLPEYMLPSHFVVMSSFPLTTSGKLNRRALPPPEANRSQASSDYVEPRTDLEKALASMWSQVLKIQSIGVEDNFFELGGHSLLATQIAARVRYEFGVDVALRKFFESPTVAGLALAIAEQEVANLSEDEASRLLSELEGLSEDDLSSLLGGQE